MLSNLCVEPLGVARPLREMQRGGYVALTAGYHAPIMRPSCAHHAYVATVSQSSASMVGREAS